MPNLQGKRHTLGDLYHERTNFNFLDRKWRWALLSGIIILAGIVGFVVRGGLNLGIDFTGGRSWQVTAVGKTPSTGDVRGALVSLGVKDPKIVIVGGNTFRVESKDIANSAQTEVTDKLAALTHTTAAKVSVSDVGPTWGGEVSKKAIQALIAFFILIAIYLALRFELKMSVAALIAVVHDILITIGVYAITGFEVTPATVVAFLTILGFSLYDTVVVFDKIKENTPQLATVKDLTYTQMANRSLNQVLMRSLNTSFVALLPVASLLVVGVWIYGALALREFGLALFVGLLAGAYSSIFVATPILAWWKEREPRYRAIRERSEVRAGRLAMAGAVAGSTAATGNAGAQIRDFAERETQDEVQPGVAATVGARSSGTVTAADTAVGGESGRESGRESGGESGGDTARESVDAGARTKAPAPSSPASPSTPDSGITPRPRQQRGRKRR